MKVRSLLDIFEVLKQKDVIEINVPKLIELRVMKMWPLICEVDDLNIYFSYLKPNQLPDRNYTVSILGTLLTKELMN